MRKFSYNAALLPPTTRFSRKLSYNVFFNVENKNLSLKSIREVFNMSKQLEEYILKNDPLRNRAETFVRNLQNILSSYQEIYKDLRNQSTQTSIKDFVKPVLVDRVCESDNGSNSDIELIRPRTKRS